MSKSVSMLRYMPEGELKHLPRNITVRLEGSEFAVQGRVDWSQMTMSEDIVVTQTWTASDTFQGRLSEKWFAGLPSDLTFAVNSEEDHWEVTLIGLNFKTFVAESLRIQRDDEKFWSYVMTATESDHLVPDYDLVFSRGWGYLAPILRYVKGSNPRQIRGRRPIALEVTGAGNYIGSVNPGVRFEGQWKILVEPDKNIGANLQGVPTWRGVRFNVQKPDRPDPIQHGVALPLHVVDLWPALVASGRQSEKARVKALMNIYELDFEAPEGKKFIPLSDYMCFADVPCMAAVYQWMCWKFTEFLGDISGMNLEAADIQVDKSESCGPIQRIGLLKRKGTWLVAYRDIERGRFARDGVAIPAVSAANFDPAVIKEEPVKIHRLHALNPNNKRLTGTNTTAGLLPVEVYEYGREVSSENLKVQTLCDFAESGDAVSQAALAEWIWHVYGPVFSVLNATTAP